MIPVLLVAVLLAAPDLRVVPRPDALDLRLRDVTSERVTSAALVGTVVLLVALEIAIVHERNSGHVVPTISQVVADAGDRYGTIPWLSGVMAGHWFWQGAQKSDRAARSDAMFLGWFTAGVVLWDAADHRGRVRYRAPVLLVGGIAAGHFLWTQSR